MYRKDNQKEFYTLKAREEGYPARSVYKLKEIDEKYRVIKKNDRVLDLGCAPGSWLLYVMEKVGDRGRVVGIDTEDIKITLKKNAVFIKKSITALDENDFKNIGADFDAVVADLAPRTSGVIFKDVGQSLELSRVALEIVKKVLKKGGNFVCKIFEGEGSDEFVREIAGNFRVLKRVRPMAVMRNSKEFYIVGLGYNK